MAPQWSLLFLVAHLSYIALRVKDSSFVLLVFADTWREIVISGP